MLGFDGGRYVPTLNVEWMIHEAEPTAFSIDMIELDLDRFVVSLQSHPHTCPAAISGYSQTEGGLRAARRKRVPSLVLGLQ